MIPAEALALFEAALQARKATPRTIENYRGVIRRIHREVGGWADSSEALRKQLRQWYQAQRSRWEADTITATKIRCDLTALRQFFDLGVESGWLEENPVIGLKPVKRPKWAPYPMPTHYQERLFELTAAVPAHQALLALFANGVRNSEACQVTTAQFTYDPKGRTLVLRFMGKGKKVDDLPLHAAIAETLALYMLGVFGGEAAATWLAEFAAKEGPRAAGERSQAPLLALDRLLRTRLTSPRLLFQVRTKDGWRPYRRRDVNRMFAHYRTVAQIPRFQNAEGRWREYGPHSLRHGFCTGLLEAGVSLAYIQKLMRHNDISVTQVYLGTPRESVSREVQRLAVAGLGGATWTP
jgi:site-specific recombinase XerD